MYFFSITVPKLESDNLTLRNTVTPPKYISGTIPGVLGVYQILDSRKCSFFSSRRPFGMAGHVFNDYASRVIDSASVLQ